VVTSFNSATYLPYNAVETYQGEWVSSPHMAFEDGSFLPVM